MTPKARRAASSVICWIYALCNIANDKVYIGQTWRPIKTRYNNGHGYADSTHIHHAIALYGADKFYYRVLTVANTQKAADYWESYFVDQYEARNPAKGYNIREAGSRGKPSDETRAKQSKAQTGKKQSDATRAKRSKSLMGNTNALGIKLSLETRQKMSKSRMGLMSGEKCPTAKATWEAVDDIRFHPNERPEVLATKWGMSARNVRDIRNYKTWKEENRPKQPPSTISAPPK